MDSCNRNGGSNTIKYYYSNGKLKEVVPINKDSMIDGTVKKFYSNQNIKLEVNYVKNKRNGIEKAYYKSGQLEHIGQYTKGLQDSIWTWFYENGYIKKTDNWVNGHLLGESKFYHANTSIAVYKFYGLHDGLIYIRKYDSSGRIIKEEGKPVLTLYNGKVHVKGDSVEMKILFGLLPNCEAKLTITDINTSEMIARIGDLSKAPNFGGGKIIIVKKAYKQIGNYIWSIQLLINDKKYERQINYFDTLSFYIK
jgi:antitoxin component YwqK of YwqJK toxin-antitoxin module